MEGDVITMNDIFQLEIQGEGADGRLFGRYKVSRVPPSFLRRLAYFGLDRRLARGARGGRGMTYQPSAPAAAG